MSTPASSIVPTCRQNMANSTDVIATAASSGLLRFAIPVLPVRILVYCIVTTNRLPDQRHRQSPLRTSATGQNLGQRRDGSGSVAIGGDLARSLWVSRQRLRLPSRDDDDTAPLTQPDTNVRPPLFPPRGG